MQWFLLLALLSVFAALAWAAYFLLGKPPAESAPNTDAAIDADSQRAEQSRKMAGALAWRVGLSIALLLLLLAAYALGWIQPQAAPISR